MFPSPPAWAADADFTFGGVEGQDEIDLDTIFNSDVVSATKQLQKLKEAPAVIEVITERDLHERGYTSVADALRTVPGFSVLYDYYNYNVGVRGISGGMRAWSRILKVMINNQPVGLRTDASTFLGPELIPLELISRIEIIRGPGSALYGADAFLGVINIVTKKGMDFDGGQLALGGTSLLKGGLNGSLALGQEVLAWDQSTDMAFGISGAQADRSGLGVASTSPKDAIFAGKATSEDVTRPRSLFGSFSVGEDSQGKFSVSTSYQRADSAGKFLDWSIGQRILDSKNHLVADNAFVRTAYDRAIDEHLSLSAGAAYVTGGPTSDDRLDIGNPNYWQVRKAGYRGVDANGEVRYQFMERNSLTVGADYTNTDQRIQSIYNLFKVDFGKNAEGSERLEGTDLGTKDFANTGLFAQGIVYPLEPLGVTVGVRSDSHNIYGNVLNSRAGLVYQWSDALTSKLLYGTSFKAPTPMQLFAAPIAVGDVIGNPDLKPETAQTVESELSWALSRNLLASTNVFFTQVQDMVRFTRQAANYIAKNTASSATMGLEGSLRWQFGPIRGYCNGAFQNTAITGDSQGVYTSNDPRSELFPSLTLNTGAFAPLPVIPADLNLEARYVGSMKPSESNFYSNGGDDYEIPASLTLDLALVSRKLSLMGQESELSLRITNLLDSEVIYPGFNGIDIPGEGRAVTARFVQHF
ncbi:MAG TPA: TonB-dependent receptor [Stenomitos sp.]